MSVDGPVVESTRTAGTVAGRLYDFDAARTSGVTKVAAIAIAIEIER